MYQSYFGMKQRPFRSTPQLNTFYPSSAQEEALATLRYCVAQGRGFGLLTGMPGTGKTLVCHRLSRELEPNFTTAMITNTNIRTVKGLLQSILYDLALPYHGMDDQELRFTLTDFVLGKYANGSRTVLIIDEAHNLAIPLLEELRMLGNLEGEADKLFQVVFVGHPRLTNVLRSSGLETLNQRIGTRAILEPLSDEETVAYIRHQLEATGAIADQVISYEAMTAVYEATGGIPRLINQICDHAMLLAYVTEAPCVDDQLVEQASADLNRLVQHDSEETGVPSEVKHREALVLCDTSATSDVEQDMAQVGIESEAKPAAVSATECATITIDEEKVRPTVTLVCELPDPTVVYQCSSDECADTYLKIVPEDRAPAAPAAVVEEATCYEPEEPAEESFENEEIIVDQYAMMDAARAARGQKPRPAPAVLLIRKTQRSVKLVPVCEVPTLPQEYTPCISMFCEPSVVAMTSDCMKIPTATQVHFVEPTDNPAVHEVGAGAETEPAGQARIAEVPTLLPILVIESRSKRIADNTLRIDAPQKAVDRGIGGYRRLFSHAKKI